MIKTFEQGRLEIERLCDYFRTNRDQFLKPGVKEAHVRQSLIDPLFEALGWDVANRGHVAPQYREVIPEDSLDVEGFQRAPDYAFRVGTQSKFYAEAKRCGGSIRSDRSGAHQLRRYGWSAKTPVSILTDFEYLAVYDCSLRPRPSDNATRGRVLLFEYTQYVERWRELWDIFSREAVWSGAFDNYAASKRKRGTSEVDVEFLKEIEQWREDLAKNLALRNATLNSAELNAAVQLTIDRVIFLRMAEDRGLEPFEQLLKLCEREDVYSRFMRDVCRKADEKYNSGLFHFQKEAGISEAPDRLTSKLIVDNRVFSKILRSLYFSHGSPYHFGVLPVEILGTVYERFLGKVIRLTAGHQAKVEEKPEVRKAGGVFYTPSFIVDSIVKNTVGERVARRGPQQLAGGRGETPFRVVDLACGSGSFLLGVYDYLLRHCLQWYVEHRPETHKRAVHRDHRNGEWRLTIEEKKRILTTHLFGVDIDPQAVEVTKLSLLLKALEGENDMTLETQLRLFHHRALPNLADNIQCGNSLISPECLGGLPLLASDELARVNPFDWARAFPKVMEEGGFDCIVGNPPYLRIQILRESSPWEADIHKRLYRSASKGNYDIYVVFIERGLDLMKPGGRLGFICPHKFFNAKYGQPIREIISRGRHLSQVVHFGHQQVFSGATTYTCLLYLNKSPVAKCDVIHVKDLAGWRATETGTSTVVKATNVTDAEWNFVSDAAGALMHQLSGVPATVDSIANRISQGIRTSANDVYVLDVRSSDGHNVTAFSRALDREVVIERNAALPFLRGRDIKPCRVAAAQQVVIMPYRLVEGRMELITPQEFQRRSPKTWKYLLANQRLLESREDGKLSKEAWYGFVYPKNLDLMISPKIVFPDMADRASFAFDESGEYAFASGYGITLRQDVQESPKYFLGLLNSSLLDFHLKNISTSLRGGYFRYFTHFVRRLPIRRIDFNRREDRQRHDAIVRLVDQLMQLLQQVEVSHSELQNKTLQTQIEIKRIEIDRIVYTLYDLSSDAIALLSQPRS